MHGRAALRGRVAWLAFFLVVVVFPGVMAATVGREMCGAVLEQISIHTGFIAFGLLVLALLLVARLPSLVASMGIESVLRSHRLVAVSAVVLVVAHILAVLVSDSRGLSIFNLAHTTNAARAAVVATVALGAIIGFALRRRRRQPRYEGWRMLHLSLAVAVFTGAWLHVWWLGHLSANLLFATWLVLMAVLVACVVLRRWVWLPARARRRCYVVEDVVPVTRDAVTVAVSAEDHPGIPFRPGQFAYLKVGHSPFMFEEHPFSIASTAHDPQRKEFTIKALGDFSELLAGIRPGRRVYVDGAYGALTIDGLESSPGFVFIAGGIGITPMVSMLRTLADDRDTRPHVLLLSARTPADLLLREEVNLLKERLDLTVVEVVEQPPESWVGEVGRIDRNVLDRALPRRSRRHLEFFVCGPPMMVLGVTAQLRALGIRARRIHTERFEVI